MDVPQVLEGAARRWPLFGLLAASSSSSSPSSSSSSSSQQTREGGNERGDNETVLRWMREILGDFPVSPHVRSWSSFNSHKVEEEEQEKEKQQKEEIRMDAMPFADFADRLLLIDDDSKPIGHTYADDWWWWYLQWRDLPLTVEDVVPYLEHNGLGQPHQQGEEREKWERWRGALTTLVESMALPDFLDVEDIVERNFWIGRTPTSHIHFDGHDNVHYVLSGCKVVDVYPPSDLCALYPVPFRDTGMNNTSQVRSILFADDAHHGDAPVFLAGGKMPSPYSYAPRGTEEAASCCRHRERYPLFYTDTHRQRFCLRAGDALFLPAGWWHEFFTPVASVSVNVWYRAPAAARMRSTLLYEHSAEYVRFLHATHRLPALSRSSCATVT